MGNPFLDTFPKLVTLDESVVDAMYKLEDTGIQQYQYFVKNVLIERTEPINKPGARITNIPMS